MRRVMASGVVAMLGVALWVLPAGASAPSTSNGEAAKSATTILADAKAATSASSAVRVSGTVVKGGQRTTLNIVSARGGGGGTITTAGATLTIVVVPPNVYMKADKSSWTKLAKSAAAGQLFAGKWLQTTTADANFGSFAQLLDTGTLTQQITSSGKITKGPVTTFRGKQAVPLNDSSGNGGTLYVAATGTPYILGLAGTGAHKSSQIVFTQYGTAPVPNAPTTAISLAQLEQSAGSSQ